MVTKYIIEMTHHRAIGDDLPYYYRGEAGGYMEKKVPLFDYRKTLAKRYDFEYEALHDMRILQVMYHKEDSFKVTPIRCRN